MLSVTTERDPFGFLDDLVGVYREAFAGPPYHEDDVSAERFRESIAQHASHDGFRCVVAKDDRLVGFAYGCSGRPGSWWYEHVSAALSEQQVGRWLTDYFELVDLAVLPDRQGEGIGGSLHDSLLAEATQRTAALSVAPGTVAEAMYRARGWEPLATGLIFGMEVEHTTMGIELSPRCFSLRGLGRSPG